MAATAAAVVRKARGQIGYNGKGTATRPSSKFGVWYGINPAHWCAMFVSWCLAAAGNPLTIETQKGFAACEQGRLYFRRHGQWHGKNVTPRPGDIAFFDFKHEGESHHVGIVVSATDPQHIRSVQGNTSDLSIGRKNNCCRMKEHTNKYVMGYGRPSYARQGAAQPGFRTHKVSRGETLSGIALKLLGKASRFKEIAELNRIPSPYTIYEGQVLRIPNN
jgi:hypothetical protein